MTPRSKALLWGAGLILRSIFDKAASRVRVAWAPLCALTLACFVLFALLDSATDLRLAWLAEPPPKPASATPTPEQIAKALASGSTLSVTASKFDDDGSLLLVIKAPPKAYALPAKTPSAEPRPRPFGPSELGGWLLFCSGLWAAAVLLGLATLLQGAASVLKAVRAGRSGPAAFDAAFGSGAFREGSLFGKLVRVGAVDSYFNIVGAPADPPFARLRFAIAFPLTVLHLFGLGACCLAILFALMACAVSAVAVLFAPLLDFPGQAPWVAGAVPWTPWAWAVCSLAFGPSLWRAFRFGTPALAASAAGSAAKARDALLKAGASKLADEEEKALAAETADAPCKKSPPTSL